MYIMHTETAIYNDAYIYEYKIIEQKKYFQGNNEFYFAASL